MRTSLEGNGILRHASRYMAVAIVCSVAVWGPPAYAQSLPPNPAQTCTVPAPTFASWFQSGRPSLNGVVNPADSVTFNPSSNCTFYQWSEQMFLWMTSPAPANYGGGGGRIFDSPTFFDVSPPNANGQRIFLPHVPGFIHPLALRAAQVGPHGLPVVMSRAGQLLEVEPAPPNAVPQIRDESGKLVPIPHVKLDNGKPVLLDRAGKEVKFSAVPVPKAAPLPPQARTGLPPMALVRKFVVDKVPIFIDPDGNVIQSEEGQAGGGDVLMAQTGRKLIYYVTMSNDVFAYYRTMLGTTVPTTAVFPTTQQQLDQIVQYAASRGRTLVDADALAIEVKSSWIEADGLPNLSSYITMKATTPTYNTSSSTTWTQNGQKTIQLALLGVHVVGSTAGHPEMIWATFEHANNTPNAAYSYVNTSNQTVAVAQNTTGTWLFTESGASSGFNQAHMAFANPSPCAANSICAVSPFSISASNTIRLKPFGAAFNTRPNPFDATAAASNSEIIAINNSVRGQLVGGDIRGNYTMIGATWTNGNAPTGSFSQAPRSGWPAPNEVGTSLLANSTMETYQQGTSNDNSGSNCFACHSLGTASQTTATTALSHVFGVLQPLPR
jgi:hypothetical protein